MSETELIRRVEKLERDNRRLKGFGLATLVLATALTTIYATQSVPQKITAHEFDAVDDSGKVRVSMSVNSADMSRIQLYDAQGRSHVDMLVAPYDSQPLIALSDAKGRNSAQISVNQGGWPAITLFDPTAEVMQAGVMIDVATSGEPSIALYDAKGSPQSPRIARIGVSSSGAPVITLADANGFEMDLGSTGTLNAKTGATEQTSAASIVMFGNDEGHHVIWKAP